MSHFLKKQSKKQKAKTAIAAPKYISLLKRAKTSEIPIKASAGEWVGWWVSHLNDLPVSILQGTIKAETNAE